jgi:hypothetical protein
MRKFSITPKKDMLGLTAGKTYLVLTVGNEDVRTYFGVMSDDKEYAEIYCENVLISSVEYDYEASDIKINMEGVE